VAIVNGELTSQELRRVPRPKRQLAERMRDNVL
jgi:hypothetical protein